MTRVAAGYLAAVAALAVGWLWLRAPALAGLAQGTHLLEFLGVIVLYLGTHFIRMLRLALLTLDEREQAFPLLSAHALTALPSSFLPFKIGEVLRLGSFFYVYRGRRKALAVWLAERFGDVVVVAALIFGLYLFNITVPPAMRTVFVLFVLAGMLSLLGLFAVAKISIYLNRHLVLASHSARGLALLRFSHSLRLLEKDIHQSVEGRLAGFLLLSVLVWAVEIIALSFFIDRFALAGQEFGALFASGLLASLTGEAAGDAVAFALLRSLALALLTLVFLAAVPLAARFKTKRP